MILLDPQFPLVGRMTSKSSLSTMLIYGSNAAGEALPPHILKGNDETRYRFL
jgi:hypothetical protein